MYDAYLECFFQLDCLGNEKKKSGNLCKRNVNYHFSILNLLQTCNTIVQKKDI